MMTISFNGIICFLGILIEKKNENAIFKSWIYEKNGLDCVPCIWALALLEQYTCSKLASCRLSCYVYTLDRSLVHKKKLNILCHSIYCHFQILSYHLIWYIAINMRLLYLVWFTSSALTYNNVSKSLSHLNILLQKSNRPSF